MRTRLTWRLADLALYAGVALLPLLVLALLMRLWELDIAVPFAYGGDEILSQAGIKGLLETGSIWTNPSLGAPGVAQAYDFPGADALNWIAVGLLGLIGGSSGAAINLLYLLGYPAAGLATAFAMRRVGFTRIAAFVVAVLFALLPFHWQQGVPHIFLSVYWIIPLVVLVLAWIESPQPPFVSDDGHGFTLRTRRSVAALAVFGLLGASGVYYLFFGCFFLVLVGMRAAALTRTPRPLLAVVALVGAAALVCFAQMAPTLVYAATNGRNPVVGVRSPFESEVYGLRIVFLLLPDYVHRIPWLAEKTSSYIASSAGAGFGSTAYLGLVGLAGFATTLFAVLLAPMRDNRVHAQPTTAHAITLRWLGILSIAGVLLATVSGFGRVFASIVTAQIRVYDRISVFLALLALLAVGLLVDIVVGRFAGRRRLAIGALLAVALIGVGIYDQTPPDMSSDAQAALKMWAADEAFGREVSAALPKGTSIFQIPYIPYPESAPLNAMSVYDPLRGYLHTTGFRWSAGSMAGRPDAAWQQSTAALPAPAMIARLRASGFGAIWVQLNGYADGGRKITSDLDALLGSPAAVSADGVYCVWRL